ncbi:MAG: hypothetical protein ACTSUT_06805 [Promethearchaeota archaeon]
MKYRIVKVIRPYKSKNNNLITVYALKIRFTKKNMTIYDTVDLFKKKIKKKIKSTNKQVKDLVQLREIINLHDNTGIKNISQIISMIKQIKSGKDILSPNGLPNIKLVKTEQSEWVLFDGHHSLLAYMIGGKKYLNQIPHLIIENENGHVTDKEILVFFGIHSKKLKDSDWRKYVINWQAPKEKQLCKRVQRNIGELLDSINLFSNNSNNN